MQCASKYTEESFTDKEFLKNKIRELTVPKLTNLGGSASSAVTVRIDDGKGQPVFGSERRYGHEGYRSNRCIRKQAVRTRTIMTLDVTQLVFRLQSVLGYHATQ